MKKFRQLVDKYKEQAKIYLENELQEKKKMNKQKNTIISDFFLWLRKIWNYHNNRKRRYYDKYGFDYYKFFDIPEGKDHPRFEDNDYKFKPHLEQYTVDKIDKISDKKVRVSFHFLGGKGKSSMENGRKVHYYMMAKYVGSILCDEVTLIKEEEAKSDDNVIFTINKEPESRQKVIDIQNPEVGKVIIQCNKLYAEKLDCYFYSEADGWHKEGEHTNKWQQMLNESKDNYDLRFLIDVASDEWKEKALIKLSKNSPTDKDIEYLTSWSPSLSDEWKRKAKKIILANRKK